MYIFSSDLTEKKEQLFQILYRVNFTYFGEPRKDTYVHSPSLSKEVNVHQFSMINLP